MFAWTNTQAKGWSFNVELISFMAMPLGRRQSEQFQRGTRTVERCRLRENDDVKGVH